MFFLFPLIPDCIFPADSFFSPPTHSDEIFSLIELKMLLLVATFSPSSFSLSNIRLYHSFLFFFYKCVSNIYVHASNWNLRPIRSHSDIIGLVFFILLSASAESHHFFFFFLLFLFQKHAKLQQQTRYKIFQFVHSKKAPLELGKRIVATDVQ